MFSDNFFVFGYNSHGILFTSLLVVIQTGHFKFCSPHALVPEGVSLPLSSPPLSLRCCGVKIWNYSNSQVNSRVLSSPLPTTAKQAETPGERRKAHDSPLSRITSQSDSRARVEIPEQRERKKETHADLTWNLRIEKDMRKAAPQRNS